MARIWPVPYQHGLGRFFFLFFFFCVDPRTLNGFNSFDARGFSRRSHSRLSSWTVYGSSHSALFRRTDRSAICRLQLLSVRFYLEVLERRGGLPLIAVLSAALGKLAALILGDQPVVLGQSKQDSPRSCSVSHHVISSILAYISAFRCNPDILPASR